MKAHSHLEKEVADELGQQGCRGHKRVFQLQRIYAQGHAVDLDDADAQGAGDADARGRGRRATRFGVPKPAMGYKGEVAPDALQVQLLKVPLAAHALLCRP